MLLAGDIGGTKTRLAVYQVDGPQTGRSAVRGALTPVAEQTFPSAAYASLDAIVTEFLARHRLVVAQAGFGVAGPVIDGRVEVTNLPWVVDAARLARVVGIPAVALLNDLEAMAWGVAALGPADFQTLNAGAAGATGNAAVIAAGTGLGMAGLYWDGAAHRPFACEGGHGDFPPRNALEVELLRYLLARYEHVSYERILSGPGLVNVYEFLRDTGRGEEPAGLAEAMLRGDPAAVIAEVALAGASSRCEQALDLFVAVYGAAAGNLALQLMATGGVYVGGGIAPKIVRKLAGPAFMQAFVAKGRLQPLLEAIPVHVILNDRAALLGAARCALLGPRGRRCRQDETARQ
jgi:glucokinase